MPVSTTAFSAETRVNILIDTLKTGHTRTTIENITFYPKFYLQEMIQKTKNMGWGYHKQGNQLEIEFQIAQPYHNQLLFGYWK